MNFAFTEEQEELRNTIRAFLEAKSSEEAVREQMETDQGYDPEVWTQMAEQMGLQGLAIPEEYGGSGSGSCGPTSPQRYGGRRRAIAPSSRRPDDRSHSSHRWTPLRRTWTASSPVERSARPGGVRSSGHPSR